MEDPLNPIMEILDCRRTISECLTEIHLFLDHNRILIPQDINDIFGAVTQNLDAIIQHANELQNIGEDQINIIDGLQILLDESFERTNRLDQELINTHANFTYERNGRRHWENIAQNIQRERDQSRRNAHRLLQRYNADTERWRRRHAGCVNQARNWKGQYWHSQTQLQNTQISSKMLRISLII
jgi:hypothetical protein